MGKFVKGDVIVTPFPFSDLQVAKRRPALVVATFTGDDVLLCQITSQAVSDSYAIPWRNTDFTSGRLAHDSNIRPNRLFTADSNIILYEGLVSLLAEQEDITVIGAAASGNKALEKITELRPEVALIDIGVPGKDGLTVTQALRREAPEVKVFILGMLDLTDDIMACIEAGAAGYVLKEASFDYLVDTIRAVHRGESFCSPRMAASLFSRIAELASAHQPRLPQRSLKLTARELDIIHEIAQGLSNKEIAQRLFIEPQTVKNHVHNILDKLQLHTRLEAVHYARERNLLKQRP